ncbi:MAG: type III polyketide synthase [Alphaproteobacteria bacterium]|nr:type III polyketide synthase [Alphaproteobacteria bacterium]
MSAIPHIASLAVAVPPLEIRQQEVAAAAGSVFSGRSETFERLRPIYKNAGIEKRYSCVPLSWYLQPHGWRERHDIFVESAIDLLRRAATDCLEQANVEVAQVDGIVVVSTTGMTAPSLDARLMEHMNFRRDVQRLPAFGLGCAGGVLGLSRTAALARADPSSHWLFLVVELCGLTFRSGDQSNSNIVATALFGDGAAAALVSCDAEGPAITASGEHTWPGSLDVMGWQIEDDGFGVLFSRDIPALVRGRFREATGSFLAAHGHTLDDIDALVMHPGGAKVIDALQEALGAPHDALDTARSVLREYGNMSAATILFVLHRVLASDQRGRMLLGALGPGFTAGFAILERDG